MLNYTLKPSDWEPTRETRSASVSAIDAMNGEAAPEVFWRSGERHVDRSELVVRWSMIEKAAVGEVSPEGFAAEWLGLR